jgi:FKBP-type peptidyl-prolyl cis-trans isomerase
MFQRIHTQIHSWNDVLETMKRGEIAKVVIKPEKGYGKLGRQIFGA